MLKGRPHPLQRHRASRPLLLGGGLLLFIIIVSISIISISIIISITSISIFKMFWKVVSHGGTIVAAFSFLYSYMWCRFTFKITLVSIVENIYVV